MNYTTSLIDYLETNMSELSLGASEVKALILTHKTEYADEKAKFITFGKYKNKLMIDIIKIDRPYMEWMSRQSFVNESVKTKITTLLAGN